MNLKKSATSGIKWSTASRVGQQGIQFITLTIFARLLQPEDFGLMASAMVIIGFINVFRDLGIPAAIIQRQEITDDLFSSLFWLSVITGVILMIGLILVSPLLAEFFNNSGLIPILKVLSFSFLFSSLSNVQQAMLEKEMNFKSIAKYEICGTLLSAISGISVAFLNFGVWSLVTQNIVFTLTITILLWFNVPHKPKLLCKWKELKSIANFSGNLAGFNILNYFVRNADYILIQKYLGSQQLGYYTLAYRLMLYPLRNITVVVTRVMFPVLSKIQQDDTQFKDIYLKLVSSIALITFPLMLGLTAVSDNFVLVLLGAKWEPVITLIVILAPLGLIQSIYTPAGMIYQSKGRTDLWFRWGLFSGLLFVSAFWIGLRWGIIGVALAYLIVNVITLYPGLVISFNLIKLKVQEFVYRFNRIFIISLSMFLIVIILKHVLNIYFDLTISLVSAIVIGVIAYSWMSYRFNKDYIMYVYESIKN